MSPRLVPLDRFLLDRLVAAERDPITAQQVSHDGFAPRVLAVQGLAYALLDGGMPMAGFGLVTHWHGRAEAWQLSSRHARPRQLAMAARMGSRLMDARQRDPAYRRVEAYVQCSQRWALSFIETLGFERKCVLAQWDPAGRDVWFCERIREAA